MPSCGPCFKLNVLCQIIVSRLRFAKLVFCLDGLPICYRRIRTAMCTACTADGVVFMYSFFAPCGGDKGIRHVLRRDESCPEGQERRYQQPRHQPACYSLHCILLLRPLWADVMMGLSYQLFPAVASRRRKMPFSRPEMQPGTWRQAKNRSGIRRPCFFVPILAPSLTPIRPVSAGTTAKTSPGSTSALAAASRPWQPPSAPLPAGTRCSPPSAPQGT